jgi:hypothetical protein
MLQGSCFVLCYVKLCHVLAHHLTLYNCVCVCVCVLVCVLVCVCVCVQGGEVCGMPPPSPLKDFVSVLVLKGAALHASYL